MLGHPGKNALAERLPADSVQGLARSGIRLGEIDDVGERNEDRIASLDKAR